MQNLFDVWRARGFIDAVTHEDLSKVMSSPISAYVGIDPTADSLHLGNLVGIVACAWLQRFGHTPVILIGGGTARIGDPSGKNGERPLLPTATIESNVALLRAQCERLLTEAGRCPRFVNNNDWLSSWKLIDFLRDIGKSFRLGTMLGKESVRSRMQSDEGMSFTEFSYQLLQGYDFHHLFHAEGVVLQLGGSDQWGNITAGVELIRKLSRKAAYGLAHPLMTRSDGAKFGKSEQGAIWLDATKTSPYQFYQYLIQVADADVGHFMRMLTLMDLEEITACEQELATGNFVPYAAQKRLAEEVTRFVHGQEKLELAQRVTQVLAPGADAVLDVEVLREVAHATPSVAVPAHAITACSYAELAVQSKLVKSKSEATRLIKQGGAYLNNTQVKHPSYALQPSDLIGGEYVLIGAGKKKKILIRVEERA